MQTFDQKMHTLLQNGQPDKIFDVVIEKNAFFKHMKINPSAAFLNILSLPVYITWFFSIRNLLLNQEMLAEAIGRAGYLWVQTIANADPYIIFPFITAICTFCNIHQMVNIIKKNPVMPPEYVLMISFLRFVPFLSIPATMFLPTGLHVYFIAISLSNLVISAFLESKTFRKIMKIPDTIPGTILWNRANNSLKNDSKPVFPNNSKNGMTILEKEEIFYKNLNNTPISETETLINLDRKQK